VKTAAIAVLKLSAEPVYVSFFTDQDADDPQNGVLIPCRFTHMDPKLCRERLEALAKGGLLEDELISDNLFPTVRLFRATERLKTTVTAVLERLHAKIIDARPGCDGASAFNSSHLRLLPRVRHVAGLRCNPAGTRRSRSASSLSATSCIHHLMPSELPTGGP
jgi:hypothetical protein